MNVLVGVISPAPAWVMPRAFAERLRRDFPQHTFLDAWDRDTVRALLPQADVAFTPFVDRDVFASATRLRWVQSPAVGVGSLMFPELLASDVVLTSARGIRARSIAEHVLTVTLALSRLLPLALRAQADRRWAQAELEGADVDVRLVQGQRMGIIGLGAIGLEVAKLATPLGFRVTAIRRRTDQPVPDFVEAVWTPDRLRDLLAESDVVVLAAPHTPDTKRLIGARELDYVKRGAFVINVARGKLVDDDALIAALRDGRVGGAALDVFSEEPLAASSPYWDMRNVIITPHTSGALRDYWTPLVALFSDNLRRFESGQPLLNVVDKAAGY
jgi:phosphoglycerate dehydrogenase-like enzyme